MRALFRRALPLLVGALALFLALKGIDLRDLAVRTADASLGTLLLVSAGMALLNCAADTLAMYYVFRWFGLPLRFVELYIIRAATYTLAVINYHAGQLGIIGYIHRCGKVPLSSASAYILFIVGVWVMLLLLFASGSLVLGGPKAAALLPALVAFFVGLLVYAALLTWPPRFLLTEPPAASHKADFAERLFRRLWRIAHKLWVPLHQAGVWGHVRALGIRIPHLLVLLFWHYIALRCFSINVPFHVALLYLPVVFAVTSLPISVQGLGTSQLAAVFFLSDGTEVGNNKVLAYSLTMTAISTVSLLLMGFLFLRAGARLGLKEMTAEAEADEKEEERQDSLTEALPFHKTI
ncbi:MAG TPA: lysylphosphatidylglycerol synthase domain-containing protein [Pseudomonadota bacterium]|nr:lysylphosphatidylglycerol synthase domain-containing protein [Pseudomonadota bacterium]